MIYKPVTSLQASCLPAISALAYQYSTQASRQSLKYFSQHNFRYEYSAFNNINNNNNNMNTRDLYLSSMVSMFKEHLTSHVVWYLHEEVCRVILMGLDKAVRDVTEFYQKLRMNNIGRMHELAGIVTFAEVTVIPSLRTLRLDQIPSSLRGKMIHCLPQLNNLKILQLVGGFSGMEEQFSQGIRQMKQLLHFSLKFDCTNHILQVLSDNCFNTLIVLDVEYSQQVDDKILEQILYMKKLRELNIFHTGISIEGKTKLIKYIPNLEILTRGDFLCEVLEYIEKKNPQQLNRLRLKLRCFWASEDYLFHSSSQMKLVARICPDISKMLFKFDTSASSLHDITKFEKLKDLDLRGGSFYSDSLCLALMEVGPQLDSLSLGNVGELDKKAVAIISRSCPNVSRLAFYNCGFMEPDMSQAETFQYLVDRVGEREERLEPMKEVSHLKIVSEIGCELLVSLIDSCPSVTRLSLGISTSISDSLLGRVFSFNSLKQLQHFHVMESSQISMKGVSQLLSHCPSLVSCHPLPSWTGISSQELEDFIRWIKENNILLKVGQEEEEMIKIKPPPLPSYKVVGASVLHLSAADGVIDVPLFAPNPWYHQ